MPSLMEKKILFDQSRRLWFEQLDLEVQNNKVSEYMSVHIVEVEKCLHK